MVKKSIEKHTRVAKDDVKELYVNCEDAAKKLSRFNFNS